MRKRINFDAFRGSGWPEPKQLEPYFLTSAGREWFSTKGELGASLRVEGLDGTGHLEAKAGRIDTALVMFGDRDHGVLLGYSKWDGSQKRTYNSEGDLSRLNEWVHGHQDDLLPVGLFISLEKAWSAVKEFMESDGALPKSINWVATEDLPPNTFPDRSRRAS